MMKAVTIYKIFFIGFLLMHGLNPSTKNPLSRYDRRLRGGQPSPPTPQFSKPNHYWNQQPPPDHQQHASFQWIDSARLVSSAPLPPTKF
ncbi:hypothetical protein CDL12_19637 [Handroanthus impetiginosus]|uniref:Uncharacterized protein n=1 Tax=Handroanthus impetiginosus TaxID=429701 RepID=A0A2G9GR75_9LAMI|nr:hypothetical protein CDL12_19637 [Handroanthus impetiginosus]